MGLVKLLVEIRFSFLFLFKNAVEDEGSLNCGSNSGQILFLSSSKHSQMIINTQSIVSFHLK